MPIYQLPEDEYWFPPLEEMDGDIVAVGGDLTSERLITAYCHGIFPWYNDPGEIIWWSPADRCVLFLDELKVSKSMRNIINRRKFRVTMDTDFRGVLEGCRSGIREGATWLLDEMVEAYLILFKQGHAHSVEVWEGDELVGGLYGESLGHMFFGESMFAKSPNSSKLGFIYLVQFLKSKGFNLIDCQVYNDHLGSLGARVIPRVDFMTILEQELSRTKPPGKWTDEFSLVTNSK